MVPHKKLFYCNGALFILSHVHTTGGRSNMRVWIHSLLIFLVIFAPLTIYAGSSLLRVKCEGDDVGAEVYVNGKFKGDCPIDMQVPSGKLKLRVVKEVDDAHEKVYEQEIRMGEGSVKKIGVALTTRLSSKGKINEDKRIANEAASEAIRNAAKVYVYREKAYGGSNSGYSVYANNSSEIGFFNNGSYTVYSPPNGALTLSSNCPRSDPFLLNIEPAKTYYVKFSLGFYSCDFEQVGVNTGASEVSRLTKF
jgi:hypothetical protein